MFCRDSPPATVSESATINGFTSTISNAIVTHREENGQFETIEALEDVYGIGPATYKKVRDYVILHE